MADHSDVRIIYPQDNGIVAVVVPATDDLSLEEIIAQSVPAGKPYKVVSVADIPTDRTFRSAWEYVND